MVRKKPIVRSSSEDLSDVIWDDANPPSTYMQGAIKVLGSQENMMRLDAMAMLILFRRVGEDYAACRRPILFAFDPSLRTYFLQGGQRWMIVRILRKVEDLRKIANLR
jgi:hypothetical protein